MPLWGAPDRTGGGAEWTGDGAEAGRCAAAMATSGTGTGLAKGLAGGAAITARCCAANSEGNKKRSELQITNGRGMVNLGSGAVSIAPTDKDAFDGG